MPDLLPVTDGDMLAEVERELRMREKMYKHLIFIGELSQQKADRQIERMEAVRDLLFARVYKK